MYSPQGSSRWSCIACHDTGIVTREVPDQGGSCGTVTVARACHCAAGKNLPRCRGCGAQALPGRRGWPFKEGWCANCDKGRANFMGHVSKDGTTPLCRAVLPETRTITCGGFLSLPCPSCKEIFARLSLKAARETSFIADNRFTLHNERWDR